MRNALPETHWYSATEEAAKADRLSKWQLIQAIAKDAVDNDLRISGEQSCLAAFKALNAAGHEHTDQTVRNLCLVAKFDHESDTTQRRIWRRYGWTTVREVVKVGFSPAEAAVLLGGEHLTRREVVARVRAARDPGVPYRPTWTADPLDPGEWAEWLREMGRVLRHGARLATRTENAEGVVLGAHDALAFLLYQRITERQLDAEIRQLLESERTQ